MSGQSQSELEAEVSNLPAPPPSASSEVQYVDFETSKTVLKNKVSSETLLFLDSDHILEQIKQLPVDPFGSLHDVPEEELDPKNADIVRKQFTRKEKPSELIKMTEESRILHLVDNKQSKKFVTFFAEDFNRKIIPVEEFDNMNCMLDSIIFQLGNKNFIPKKDGKSFAGSDLRKCVISNAVNDPETAYNLVKEYLTCSFVQYLYRQMSDYEESDYALFILTKWFLDVSRYL